MITKAILLLMLSTSEAPPLELSVQELRQSGAYEALTKSCFELYSSKNDIETGAWFFQKYRMFRRGRKELTSKAELEIWNNSKKKSIEHFASIEEVRRLGFCTKFKLDWLSKVK